MAIPGKENTGQGAAPVVRREYKAVKFDLESADEQTGEFAGYAAVFGNLDGGRDIIQPGAFSKTIEQDFPRIKILSQHNEYELPIGKPIELREDAKGLYIRGKISNTAKGRDIQTLLKDGVLNELSIGYDAVEFDFDGEKNIRYLKEVRLWEVSVVTWAMNDQATIDEVKSLTAALREEAKSGKITPRRMAALKPFIAVVRELSDILGMFIDQPSGDPTPAAQDPPPAAPPAKPSVPPKKQKKSNTAGMIIEIVPTKNRR